MPCIATDPNPIPACESFRPERGAIGFDDLVFAAMARLFMLAKYSGGLQKTMVWLVSLQIVLFLITSSLASFRIDFVRMMA